MPTQVFYGHLNEFFNANLKTIEFFLFSFFYELCGKHIVISFKLCKNGIWNSRNYFLFIKNYPKLTVFAAECDLVAGGS